jgi:uncharacterized protein YjiS (DUF1127 family)
MKKVYLATVIAIVITTSIASHVLAVGALGSTTPTFLTSLRSGIRGFFNRLANFIDDWIAAMLAHRERQATIFMLNYLTDRELKDIGLYRSNIVFDPRFSERGAASRHWRQGIRRSTRAAAMTSRMITLRVLDGIVVAAIGVVILSMDFRSNGYRDWLICRPASFAGSRSLSSLPRCG